MVDYGNRAPVLLSIAQTCEFVALDEKKVAVLYGLENCVDFEKNQKDLVINAHVTLCS